MARVRPIQVVEIDLPYCANTYGVAPCTAAVGVTGAAKCYNTTRTCQDKAHFTRTVLTVRFCEAHAELDYDAFPALQSVDVTPCIIDVGTSMGVRATLKLTLADFAWSDAGLDKYLATRPYDAFNQGTFWAKLRARIPSLESCAVRLRRGFVGDDLADYSTEHYVIDTAVSDEAGVTITAKDPLALTDAKKAQAPTISGGRITAGIDDNDLAFTLTPAGVGDLEYPSAGKLCLSGKELVSYTRTGDAVTLTARGLLGTDAQAHSSDAIAQVVLEFTSVSASDILYSLFVTYTPGVDPAWIDKDAWDAEVDTYIGHLYSATIPAPTDVSLLLNEVIAQAGLALWWDVEAKRVQLQSLRPVVPGATTYDNSLIEAGTLEVKENPGKRVSQAWTYYGVANPVNKLDKEANFRAAIATLGTVATLDYELPAIRKTLSRWITVTNRAAAERLNQMLLARFEDAPRSAQFQLQPDVQPQPDLGTGVYVAGSMLQDVTGAVVPTPFFVTSVELGPTVNTYTLEEFNFSQSVPTSSRAIFIEVDAFNVNLWDLYNSLYSDAPADLVLTVYITGNAVIGSTSSGAYSLVVPADFPVGATIKIQIADGGGVAGHGGDGGGNPDLPGQDGGPALFVGRPVEIVNQGVIGGGGGGGAGVGEGEFGMGLSYAGGGSGAGYNRKALVAGVPTRLGGTPGVYATTLGGGDPQGYLLTGGTGSVYPYGFGTAVGGDGGDLGEPGASTHAGTDAGLDAIGGDPGAAVVGDSFVTWTTLGNVYGARVG